MKTNLSSVITILAMVAAGCQDTDVTGSDRIFLLTGNDSKVWTTINIDSDTSEEGINCEADDVLELQLFNPTQKEPRFWVTDGFMRCFENDSDYQLRSGSWRLNNERTRIIFTYGQEIRFNELYDILELTAERMVLRKRSESLYDLDVTTEIFTYESR